MAKNDTKEKRDPRLGRAHEELDALHEALEREIKKERRGRYGFIVVVLILTGVVFGYMWWLHGELKRTVTPRGVSELVERYSRDILPGLGVELSRSLKAAAPDVARELRTTFLSDVLPGLRTLGEDQLLSLSSGAVAVAEKQLVATVATIIGEHKAEILAHSQSDATTVGNPLSQSLEKALSLELQKRLSESPEEPLYAQLEESKRQLRAIDHKLRALAEKKDLSRVESLEKRLITSWMALVDQKMKDSDGPPVPKKDAAKKAPPEQAAPVTPPAPGNPATATPE